MFHYFLMPPGVDARNVLISAEIPYYLQTGNNYLMTCATYWALKISDHSWSTPIGSGSYNFEWLFHDWPLGSAMPWDTPPPELWRRHDFGEIDLLGERDFRRIELLPGDPDSPSYIEPTEEMEPCSLAEVADGVPFALYYRWEADASGAFMTLSIPPQLPTDGPPDIEEYPARPRILHYDSLHYDGSCAR